MNIYVNVLISRCAIMCLLLFIRIAVLHNTYTCMNTYYKFGYALLTCECNYPGLFSVY